MIKILFTIVFFSFFGVFSQDDCNQLTDYKYSQNWIRNIKEVNTEQQKDAILKFYTCHSDDINKKKLPVMIVYDGVVLDNLPNVDHIIKRKELYHIDILNSACERNVYPQRCELATILIETKKGLITNDIAKLSVLKIKNSKIYLKAQEDMEIEIISTDLYNGSSVIKNRKKLYKGKNKIRLAQKNNILITIKNKSDTMIISF